MLLPSVPVNPVKSKILNEPINACASVPAAITNPLPLVPIDRSKIFVVVTPAAFESPMLNVLVPVPPVYVL